MVHKSTIRLGISCTIFTKHGRDGNVAAREADTGGRGKVVEWEEEEDEE